MKLRSLLVVLLLLSGSTVFGQEHVEHARG